PFDVGARHQFRLGCGRVVIRQCRLQGFGDDRNTPKWPVKRWASPAQVTVNKLVFARRVDTKMRLRSADGVINGFVPLVASRTARCSSIWPSAVLPCDRSFHIYICCSMCQANNSNIRLTTFQYHAVAWYHCCLDEGQVSGGPSIAYLTVAA